MGLLNKLLGAGGAAATARGGRSSGVRTTPGRPGRMGGTRSTVPTTGGGLLGRLLGGGRRVR